MFIWITGFFLCHRSTLCYLWTKSLLIVTSSSSVMLPSSCLPPTTAWTSRTQQGKEQHWSTCIVKKEVVSYIKTVMKHSLWLHLHLSGHIWKCSLHLECTPSTLTFLTVFQKFFAITKCRKTLKSSYCTCVKCIKDDTKKSDIIKFFCHNYVICKISHNLLVLSGHTQSPFHALPSCFAAGQQLRVKSMHL